MRLGKYLKVAFLNHWNLLAFLGGSVFALLTPIPDAILALVAAGELAYLGMLGTHPKFQSYVEAQEAKKTREVTSATSQQTLERITSTLPKELLDRFTSLRARCLELQQIAAELKQSSHGSADAPLETYQIAGLDRLLWSHLRLLFTQNALFRFLKQTSEEQIRAGIQRLEESLAKIPKENADDQQARARKALEDNLQTSRERLANLQRARGNFDFVKLEIDRLENKISSLMEQGVNRQDPDYISGQVDQVAASMKDTEQTMSELQMFTGLDANDEAPSLLQNELVRPARTKQLN